MTMPEIRTLPNGTIDMNYYHQQARQARAAALGAGLRALSQWLKARLRIRLPHLAPFRLGHH